MDLKNIIKLSKFKDFSVIDSYKNECQNHIDRIELFEIIEIPFKGNYQLDMVFSKDKNYSVELFLFKAFEVLEYEVSEEIIFYSFKAYLYDKMQQELSFPGSKEALFRNNVSKENCISIIKLKEKDELTFLIETTNNYIFISEYFWKS